MTAARAGDQDAARPPSRMSLPLLFVTVSLPPWWDKSPKAANHFDAVVAEEATARRRR
jgi:hypothetical protein